MDGDDDANDDGADGDDDDDDDDGDDDGDDDDDHVARRLQEPVLIAPKQCVSGSRLEWHPLSTSLTLGAWTTGR